MKIFISHSSADNDLVKKAVKMIEKYRLEYWVDYDQIEEGDSITEKINEGLRDSTHFFLMWSKKARNSQWVTEETSIIMSPGYKEKLTRILFVLEELEPPYGFSMYQHWIDDEKVDGEVKDVVKNILKVDTDTIDAFDDHLDDSFEEIKLVDSYYPLSTTLKRTDKAKYETMLQQYVEQQIQQENEEENNDE